MGVGIQPEYSIKTPLDGGIVDGGSAQS